MRRPKVTLPEEDPATKAAREREQRRAENTRTEETQALLLGDTVRRLRRFGRVGQSGGSVPIYGGSRGGGSGSAPSIIAGGGSSGGGASFSGGSGGGRNMAVLY